MNKQILPILIAYYSFLFGSSITIFKDYIQKHVFTFFIVVSILCIIPLFVFILIKLSASFAKLFRILLFYSLKINTFSIIGISVLLFFCVLMTINYLNKYLNIDLINFNIIILNIIFILYFIFFINKKIRFFEPKGLLIQEFGHIEIYLYHKGKLRHIPDPPTLQLLGYSIKDVNVIPHQEYIKYKLDSPLESIYSVKFVTINGRPEIYMIINGEKRHIPDVVTFDWIKNVRSEKRIDNTLEPILEDRLNQWKTGKPLKSLIQD